MACTQCFGGKLKGINIKFETSITEFYLLLKNVSNYIHKCKYLEKSSGISAIILSRSK
jgi:hypothetical protein